jgi:hypothetical protein
MHNLRLLSYRDERELYHRSNTIDESTRLQMSYAIYGGAGLTAILRLDNRNIKCTNDDEDMTSGEFESQFRKSISKVNFQSQL